MAGKPKVKQDPPSEPAWEEVIAADNPPASVTEPAPALLYDCRRDPPRFVRLAVQPHAVGLLLGVAVTADDVRGVSGSLSPSPDGLVAWFVELPGDVYFRDGRRAIVRQDDADALQLVVT